VVIVEPQTDRRTPRRRAGDRAEEEAADYLASIGWTVIARNVRAGRHEIDLVALEPGVPAALVFVEVRSRSTGDFGTPEESVAGRKAAGMYRAAIVLANAGRLPNGQALPRLRWRVDLVSVVLSGGTRQIRHLRGVDAS
jgi:putative endonuclease